MVRGRQAENYFSANFIREYLNKKYSRPYDDVAGYRYELMLSCWELEPDSRPTFSNLVSSLSQLLETMAEYMDVGAFGDKGCETDPVDPTDTNVHSEPGDKGSKDIPAESAEIDVQMEPVEEVTTESFPVTSGITCEETNV